MSSEFTGLSNMRKSFVCLITRGSVVIEVQNNNLISSGLSDF